MFFILLFSVLVAGMTARIHAQRTIPANTPIEIRLLHRLATNKSHQGDPVEAVLIAPIVQEGEVLVPEGSRVHGTVTHLASVGLGFVHETASIGLAIDRITLPDGTSLRVMAKVAQIENSREVVSKKGYIQGVRSTSTLSHKASGAIGTLAFSNPIALIFTTAGSSSILRFSEPEISLPANTELVLRLTQPVSVQHEFASNILPAAEGPEHQKELRQLVRRQPYRTVTDKKHVPSDITNLMLIGDDDAILRAFSAAGWLQVSSLDADSTYKTIRSMSEQQAYRTAPMSTLLLENQPPAHALAKTLDTFSKRHHLRIFSTTESWQGKPVWLSSSTQDIGIGFSSGKKTFIHQIDHNVDHERNKVVNDLLLTGCVSGINLVERSWLPKDLMNGTGEPIETDNHMAVLQFNACDHPQYVAPPSETDLLPLHSNVAQHATRQAVLSLRDTITRDNIGVTAYGMVKAGMGFKHPKPPEAPIAPDSEITEARFAVGTSVDDNAEPALQPRTTPSGTGTIADTARKVERGKYPAPTIEIGIHGGWAGYAGGNGGYVGYIFSDPTDPVDNPDIDIVLANEHTSGFNLGGSVTVDSNKYFSHEVTFDYSRTGFNLYYYAFDGYSDNATSEDDVELEPSTLSSTEVAYNLQIHARPKGSRWRPYLVVGPSFRLMHLSDAPVKKASPFFRLGLSTVGSVIAAYQYGSTPPLDGGGLFQFGLQYGAGMQYRISRRLMLRADYKETLTAQPDFFSKSKDDIFDPNDLPGYNLFIDGPGTFGMMRQQKVTTGIAFVF